jgi:hypothetical protein
VEAFLLAKDGEKRGKVSRENVRNYEKSRKIVSPNFECFIFLPFVRRKAFLGFSLSLSTKKLRRITSFQPHQAD